MVALLTIQILSIVATVLTNLIGILTFATDYWSIIIYDLGKLRSYAKWIVIDEINKDFIHLINNTNEMQNLSEANYLSSTVAIGIENNLLLYKTHKGIFRQCNYLSENIQYRLKISKCRLLKTINNQYDDIIHGMNNPGREFIRKYLRENEPLSLHNVAASCAILIVLLLCVCTLIGVTVGILNNVVLATMTIGVIYLVATMFSLFIMAIMYTIFKSERKPSNCFALEILSDELCSSRSIQLSYSFALGCVLVICCFITSVLWLSLQEKQRKFAQH